ncbi:MAG: steryl acetyl hydrolase [Planctomycetes bacterium]|nr:steryl acetyl hydrolase [Planctomycetota bacterium]
MPYHRSRIALLLVLALHGPAFAQSIPDVMKREVSPEGVAYLKKLNQRTPFGTNDFNLDALRRGMGSRREPTIKGVTLTKVKIGDVAGEWVVAAGADPEVRLLYLHGGGFVAGSGAYYLAQAAHISAAAQCAVLLPDYRLAPEHPFPAGLDDCVAAHEWMRDNGPTAAKPARITFVAGDSAGGHLTLTTLLALRDRKMALPAGGIALSPVTDLTLASESLKTVHDPIISSKTMPIFRDHYLARSDPRHPLASPVFGDYKGLPPILIQVGEHEMLRDDSIRAAKKARADGIACTLEVWPGMFHVFQSHEPLLPEAREAIAHIGAFIRAQDNAALAKTLTLYASFDKGLDADYSRGDKQCYVQQGAKLVLAKANDEAKIVADAGRFGGALHFPKKGTTRPSFKDGGVLGYNDKSWSASVSAWMKIDPDKDLEPGYCDPIQIIGDDTKRGYIFMEWSKDEKPRLFRYAIRPLFHIWNPKNQAWHEIAADKKPMVEVAQAPFARDKWTHTVFTLENINDKAKSAVGRLYINGKLQGSIEKWDMKFAWDPAKVLLVLGANYVGYMDDLAVFDRALTEAEVQRVYGLKKGIRELYR